MIDHRQSAYGHWFVLEAADRWIRAVERFAPQLTPPPLTAICTSLDPTDAANRLRQRRQAILLCEITQRSFLDGCRRLTQLARDHRHCLAVAAIDRATSKSTLMLSELGAAAIIERPEQLPALAAMTTAHFKSRRHFLD